MYDVIAGFRKFRIQPFYNFLSEWFFFLSEWSGGKCYLQLVLPEYTHLVYFAHHNQNNNNLLWAHRFSDIGALYPHLPDYETSRNQWSMYCDPWSSSRLEQLQVAQAVCIESVAFFVWIAFAQFKTLLHNIGFLYSVSKMFTTLNYNCRSWYQCDIYKLFAPIAISRL